MRPYTPLELAGRNIYIREGCYSCHSQMIRPFRDEVERYGHYSLAAKTMYTNPFNGGRNAPGRTWRPAAVAIPNEGTADNLINRAPACPEPTMPAFPFSGTRPRKPPAKTERHHA